MKAFNFAGIIAFLLLGIYSFTVLGMIFKVVEWGATTVPESGVNDGLSYVVTTIGGLISALVISQLTITKPGEAPKISGSSADGQNTGAVTKLVFLYLAVWLLVGLLALVVGVLIYPDVNQTISDVGTNWLGLAVASVFAYFGLNPQDNSDDQIPPSP